MVSLDTPVTGRTVTHRAGSEHGRGGLFSFVAGGRTFRVVADGVTLSNSSFGCIDWFIDEFIFGPHSICI